MNKYTEDELAQIVLIIISKKFDTAEKIKDEFKSNLERKIQSFHRQKLTDNELEKGSLKFATDTFNDLRRINKDIIKSKISREIIDKCYYQGIEIKEYEEYFTNLAIDLVKKLIQVNYNFIKKQIKQKKIGTPKKNNKLRKK